MLIKTPLKILLGTGIAAIPVACIGLGVKHMVDNRGQLVNLEKRLKDVVSTSTKKIDEIKTSYEGEIEKVFNSKRQVETKLAETKGKLDQTEKEKTFAFKAFETDREQWKTRTWSQEKEIEAASMKAFAEAMIAQSKQKEELAYKMVDVQAKEILDLKEKLKQLEGNAK